jgi:hypothetical protein
VLDFKAGPWPASSLLYASQTVLRAHSDWWLVAPGVKTTASDTCLLETKSGGLITLSTRLREKKGDGGGGIMRKKSEFVIEYYTAVFLKGNGHLLH